MSQTPSGSQPAAPDTSLGGLGPILREIGGSMSALTGKMGEYVDKSETRMAEALKLVRRAVLLMFLIVFIAGGIAVASTWILVQQIRNGERVAEQGRAIEDLVGKVEDVRQTAETTQSAVAVAQESIDERPIVDIVEVQPSASGQPTAVPVLRARKVRGSASASSDASAGPSVEVPLQPLPIPKEKR